MKHLLWNVDTQIDFMNENGKLPVPDAHEIRNNLQKITQCASDNFIRFPILNSYISIVVPVYYYITLYQ